MRKYLIMALVLLLSKALWAQEILAVVNDSPVSSYDVEVRMKLLELQQPGFLQSAPKGDLQKQVLEQLINEKIKAQEAARRGISVSDSDVAKALLQIEKQFNLPAGGLKEVLKKEKIPFGAVQAQLQSDLLWLQLMQQEQLPVQPISDKAVQYRLGMIKRELSKPAYMVSEIWVQDEKRANEIFNILAQGGDFSGTAHKYSNAPSALQGGAIGWIKDNYYPTEVDTVLKQMNENQLSYPIKTKNGYALLYLHAKREGLQNDIAIWELAQMALPKEKAAQLSALMKALPDCDSFINFAGKNALPQSIQRGQVAPEQLSPQIQETLKKYPLHTLIGPMQTSTYDIYFMKCGETTKSLIPPEEVVRAQLGAEQIELMSSKILKDIKRRAVVDYK